MTIPSYLAFFVVTGSIGTIAAVIFGLNQALKRASWPVRERRRTVQATSLVLTAWFALAVALASLGVYHVPGDRLPTIEFGIVIPILVGCLILWRSPVVSRAIDVTPREWVIAVQVFRVEGVIFLILYASSLLPGAFALPAGAGDMAIGLSGLAIGISAARRQQLRSRSVLQWNLLGIVDLVVALTTGFLTSPSPVQTFAFDHPNQLISMFPLVLIPTFLVPLAILLHIVSLIQLRRATARLSPGLVHRRVAQAI